MSTQKPFLFKERPSLKKNGFWAYKKRQLQLEPVHQAGLLMKRLNISKKYNFKKRKK
jgi:hypothetical protein